MPSLLDSPPLRWVRRSGRRWVSRRRRVDPQQQIAGIRKRGPSLESISDRDLAARFADLRSPQPVAGDALLDAAALVNEAVRRTLGKTYYDVQLQGGLALAEGCVAEMQTGEGKTLTTGIGAAVMALCSDDRGSNEAAGNAGVHIATTNSYLATRDADELAPPLECLGLTVGRLPDPHQPNEAASAYACDITFGTGYDFGFDRLRDEQAEASRPVPPLGQSYLDRLAGRPATAVRRVQRGHAVAIIDEADSVLIDEATMPLILAGAGGSPPDAAVLTAAADIAAALRPDRDYRLDRAERSITLTEAGFARAHDRLPASLRTRLTRPWSVTMTNALRAAHVLAAGVDYVVREGEGPTGQPQLTVQIVDAGTGRIHPERSWQDGLHQAVEHLAGVPLTPETQSQGRISRQRYFQAYTRLGGLTGTASRHEFGVFYNLPTETIPTHRPPQRRTLPLRMWAAGEARDEAITRDIAGRRGRNPQPVLVGTRTVAHSLQLSDRLTAAGIEHAVLNGVQDADEADLIAAAGQAGHITIATNMAGRGTDIKPSADALAAGGLHVIIAGPNQSSRVDRQLAGRAARQGQPGSVATYAAADDPLLITGRSELAARLTRRLRGEADAATARAVEAEVAAVQARLDREAFERRRQMVRSDAWRDDVLRTLAGRAEDFDD